MPVSQTQQGEAQIWRREVSSRYGQYPKANETLTSLPKNLEPVFYNAAQTLLMPKLDALSQQPRYVMKLAQMEPGVAWQWLPITWQPL